MKKLLIDRLNHLKSNLRDAKGRKMDKRNNEDLILDLETRINEVEFLLIKSNNKH